jgi:hypothetical protein
LKYRARVNGILAGCTPVNEPHGLFVHCSYQPSERFYHRDRDIPRYRGIAPECLDIEDFRVALRFNHWKNRFGRNAGNGQSSRQSYFEIEQALKPLAVGKNLPHLIGSNEGIKQASRGVGHQVGKFLIA